MTGANKQLAKTFAKCAPLFQALSEPARQKIILTLANTDDMSVGALAARVQLSRPAVSHHLKILRHADLVAVSHQGTENHYALKLDDALGLLTRFINEIKNC